MNWILAIIGAVLLFAALAVGAHALAVREGFETFYTDRHPLHRASLLVWRGFGLAVGKILSAMGNILIVVIVIPLFLIFDPPEPGDSKWTLGYLVRVAVFSVVAVGCFYYFTKFPNSSLGILLLLPATFAGWGLVKMLPEIFHAPSLIRRRNRRTATLPTRLRNLEECGVRLNSGISLDDLLKVESADFFDLNGYNGIVSVMGGRGRFMADQPFSDDVWYNDIECIFEPADYVRVAEHLRRLSKGDFAIVDVRVELEADGAAITLKFSLNGEEHALWAPFGDDMIDVEIWAELQGLFKGSCKGGRQLEQVVFGQDGCYFYINSEQKARLKKLGLAFFT